MKTNPIIRQVIVYKVQQWLGIFATPPEIPRDALGDHLTNAVSSQQELGWDNFIKGRISTDWGDTQAAHFQHIMIYSTMHRMTHPTHLL
eukprot:11425775-Ditylum_brightwellii.AAC.1